MIRFLLGLLLFAGAAQLSSRADDMVIRFCPGALYFPGRAPLGTGEPLTGFDRVARDFERENPGVRIRFEMVPGSREYFLTQVANGTAPDVIQVNAEEIVQDAGKGWYLPMDEWLDQPNPFEKTGLPWREAFAYPEVFAKRRAPDGKIYNLCYDINETAIYYNKTEWRKRGFALPETWEEFVEIMRQIRDSGLTPINTGLDFHVDWNLDLFFDQIYISEYASMFPERDFQVRSAANLTGVEMAKLFRKGYFQAGDPRFRELWRLIKEFRDFAPPDITHSEPFRDFLTGRTLMFWNSSFFAYRLRVMRPDFEWGIFYPPPMTKETTPFAMPTPFASLGGAGTQYAVTRAAWADTGDPATSPRLATVMRFLQWISAPEQYVRIVGERPMMLPILRGLPLPPELQDFEEILRRRSAPIRWYSLFDLRFRDNLRRNAEMFLNGYASLDEFLLTQEQNFRLASPPEGER